MKPLQVRQKLFERLLLSLLVLTVALIFFKLGSPSIWNPNEGFYAETPREMLQSGDFLTPRFNYEHRFQKPPLLYWLVASSFAVFGQGEFSTRLFPALMAVLCVVLTYMLAKEVWKNHISALLSALTLALAFDFNTAARYTSPEIVLLAMITLSLWMFYKWYASERKSTLWLMLFYASAGLATLTKGPIGLLMPAMIAVTYLLVNKDIKALRELISFKGIAIYLLMTVPWYAYMAQAYGPEFMDMVYGENMRRFLTKKTGASNLLFYFTVLPWSFFPGSLFVIPAVYRLRLMASNHPDLKFPAVWALVVFVFFSLSRTKLPPYILPMYPALAIMVGGWLKRRASLASHNLQKYLSLSGLLVAVAAMVWLRGFLPGVSPAWAVATALLAVLCLLDFRDRKVYSGLLFLGMFVFYLAFSASVLPEIEKNRHYREIAQRVLKADPAGESLFVAYHSFQYSLPFYLKRQVIKADSLDQLKGLAGSSGGTFFLLDRGVYTSLSSAGTLRGDVIWSGPYYTKSESRFLRFLIAIRDGKLTEHVVVRVD